MRALKLIASLAAAVGAAGSACAYCENFPTVEQELTTSAVVGVGVVSSARNILQPDSSVRGTFYSVKLTQVLKGRPARTIKLYSENSSGRFPLVVGVQYLIFAYRGDFDGDAELRLLVTNCVQS